MKILLLLALLLASCAPCRVDGVCQAESLARHHSAVRAGPKFVWESGAYLQVLGGHQQPLYGPGEEPYSSRAPSDEFQVALEGSIPLWRRR